MLYALQIDTVLHNFIDNRNHYLYHPHQNQDEANLPVLPVMNNQQGATSHANCKKRPRVPPMSGAPTVRVNCTFCLIRYRPHGDMECSG